MSYPDDFYTPTFPAGKSVAVSRAMGIGIMSLFLLIIFLCGILVWTVRSARVEPFVLATGGVNDQWRVIYTNNQNTTIDPDQLFQQSLIWHFTQNWFTISANHDDNDMIWNTDCDIDYCLTREVNGKNCALFCESDNRLFEHFSEDVLPDYRKLESADSTWTPGSIRMEPAGVIGKSGGTWRVKLTVLINDIRGIRAMDVIAYVNVARRAKYFPTTMGYYVESFNAYRISQ